MDSIQRETLQSLSNSVNLLLEKILSVLAELADNFWNTKSIVTLLRNMKKTLMDLRYLLYSANNKLIPSHANNRSLNFLRHAVFQVAILLDESHSLGYATVFTANQLQIHSRLTFFIALIQSKTVNLFGILEGLLSSGKQLGDDQSLIYGRDADIDKLKHLLLSSSSDGDNKIKVISIVGMGGIGKTTLAKHLYNHPQANDKFELKLWADFSTDVDDLSVFDNILESIMNTVYPIFLLVLDGVWDARSVDWTLLMDIFNVGESESKIIVTTRDERVALFMKNFLSLHYLRPLEVQDCWSLLAERTFGTHYYHRQSYLEEIGGFRKEMQEKIGREIAKKM